MKRFFCLLLATGLVISLLAGCGSPKQAAQNTRMLTDGAGRQVAVPEQVTSMVCVGVGALRYSCYLGAGGLTVGIEDYEADRSIDRLYNYVNHQHWKDLPVIGTNGVPYPETIIQAAPQVIVMSSSAAADPEELQKQTGTPVVVIPGSDAALDEDGYETLRILGQLYDLEDRAEELTRYLEGIQQDLDRRTQGIPASQKPSVYVAGVSFKGLHGFNGTEAGYGPLKLIHANNLADTTGMTGAFDLDLEQILTWDPDILLVDYSGMDLIREHYAKNPDYYAALTAVGQGRVYAQIPFRSYASNLDTALADAYYAGCMICPEAFSDIDPEEKAGEIFQILLGTNPYGDLKEAGYALSPIQIGTP